MTTVAERVKSMTLHMCIVGYSRSRRIQPWLHGPGAGAEKEIHRIRNTQSQPISMKTNAKTLRAHCCSNRQL